MKRLEPRPDFERRLGSILRRKVEYHGQVDIPVGRQDTIQNQVEIRIGMPAARKSFPTMLGISRHGEPDFRKGVLQLSLSQEKIPVTPGDLRGKGIDALRFQE